MLVKIEATKKPVDPVVKALKELSFKELSSERSWRKKFGCTGNTMGFSFSVMFFINSLNMLITRQKKNRIKNDKLFIPPSYNGYYLTTNAIIDNKKYLMEIGVGCISLTIKVMKKK